jgi:hypothetical protein
MVVVLAMIGTAGYTLRSLFVLIGKRMDARSRPGLSSEAEQRIAHIEQAVDSIAIEIERISEGQRFTTRLLSERAQPPVVSPPSSQVRS